MTAARKISNPEPPLVSIITPIYNRTDYFNETIESVLAQTFTDWELLIIDDGSETDENRIIAEEYCKRDKRIHYTYRPHAGTSAARHHGIALAEGKYLGFLDSDDRYLPQGLEILVKTLQSSEENVKMVYGDFIKYFQSENRYHPTRTTPPQPRPGLYFQFLIPGGNPVAPCACLTERSVINSIGGFDTSFKTIEDRELWSRFVRIHDIAHIPERVAIYRKHENQKTHAQFNPVRRLDNDRHAFRFFSALPMNEWFPNATSSSAQAKALDQLALKLLNRHNTPFDTALHLLRLAEHKSPSLNRQTFMDNLEKKIPLILQNQYGCTDRISIPEF
ncbi:MAG: glycosyltransferase [Chlorobiaceae bacterium]|nr:glycosyltransferase [Chlorobiaceae bacterium]NTV61884.1 glycosyltransferase [Chlorobiaceae bacterium]